MKMLNVKNAIKLNNDAASSIRSGRYRQAIAMLNRALIQLVQSSTCSVALMPNDGMKFHQGNRKRRSKHNLEIDEGIEIFNDPVTLSHSSSSEENALRLSIYCNLGIAHSGLGHDEDALSYFIKTKAQNEVLQSLSQFNQSLQGFDHRGMLALLHNLGRSSFRCHRYDDSISFYNSALHLAQQNLGYYHLHVAMTLNCIGVVRLHNHSPDNSNGQITLLFLEALAIIDALSSSSDRSSKKETMKFQACVYQNIGRSHLLSHENHQAKKMFELSYNIRRKLYGDIHYDVAIVVFNAGKAAHALGNFDESIKFYSSFVGTCSVLHSGETYRQVATALRRLGEIYHREKKDLAKALRLYVQALRQYKSAMSEDTLEVAVILNEIGAICHQSDNLTRALDVYEEAFNLLRGIDCNHPHAAITIINMAHVFQQQNKLDQALSHYHEALKILRRLPSKSRSTHLQMANVLCSIGLINDQKKKYWEATDAFEQALEIRIEVEGRNHFDVSCTLNALGLINFKQGLLDLAVCNFKDSLDIRLKQEKPNSNDISVVLFNIAAVYLEIGETDMAIHYYEQTLNHEYDSSNKDAIDILATLKCLARIHQSQGDLDEALVYYNEAVSLLLETLDNSPSTEVATLMSCIGNIYLQKGEVDKAREAYIEALRINDHQGVDGITHIVSDGINIHDVLNSSSQSAAAA